MGNGRQKYKFGSTKVKTVFFCIVLVLTEIHAGGNQVGGGRMRNWSGLMIVNKDSMTIKVTDNKLYRIARNIGRY